MPTPTTHLEGRVIYTHAVSGGRLAIMAVIFSHFLALQNRPLFLVGATIAAIVTIIIVVLVEIIFRPSGLHDQVETHGPRLRVKEAADTVREHLACM